MSKLLSLACLALLSGSAMAQAPESSRPAITATMPELIQQWREDRSALERLYPYPLSQPRNSAFANLNADWIQRMGAVDFENLSRRDQIDFLMLSDHLDFAREEWASEQQREAEAAPFLEYRSFLLPLLEAYSAREFSDARECAEAMHAATQAMEDWQARWKEEQADREEDAEPNPSLMRRVARTNGRLHRAMRHWYRFEAEYHPEFTWWCQAPWKKLDKALEGHSKFLEETIGGIDPEDEDRLIGDPIGRKRLLSALENERIAYSPEELLAIAEKEFAWCDTHRARAASEMGLEGNWRAAQAKVRGIQVEPGEQARLIQDMADEATQFFEDRDLVTIPEHCKTTWRMQMMSAERQRFSPYFTGGEVISIAYPTQGMGHEAKLQSMRGNNRHFSRAVVHHELIPGHHLQGYMARRWNTHRGLFRTPFLVEGWALYWELRLWDMDFAQGPEDEIGMLFWRSHRCARILFSLNYHLGKWSAEECVDFLVNRVGHDRRNATAEVRRSIQGGYGPLYQAAYMVGGLQLRALHAELVTHGNWTEREFHDTVLKQGSIPIEYIRAAMGSQKLEREFPVTWRFAD